MSEQKTCVKCGRRGARKFKPEGDAWVCEAVWSCRGRVAEQAHREAKPEETTCHKCGRIGWRGFVRDRDIRDRTAYMCSAFAACWDRQHRRAAEAGES